MMDDHFLLSAARNHLADALKALLKGEIMTPADFYLSRECALAAVRQLNALLRQPHRDEAQS